MSESLATAPPGELYFTKFTHNLSRCLAAGLIPVVLTDRLAPFHGDKSLLGKISKQRGSLRGLLEEHCDFPPWKFSRRGKQGITTFNHVVSDGQVFASSYVNSEIYLRHQKAESELSMLLSNPEELANRGPATLQRVLADMGLEDSANGTSEEWEEEANSYFQNMYNPLIKDAPPERVLAAKEAMQKFDACLKERRKLWQEIRSSIFRTIQESDGLEPSLSMPSIPDLRPESLAESLPIEMMLRQQSITAGSTSAASSGRPPFRNSSKSIMRPTADSNSIRKSVQFSPLASTRGSCNGTEESDVTRDMDGEERLKQEHAVKSSLSQSTDPWPVRSDGMSKSSPTASFTKVHFTRAFDDWLAAGTLPWDLVEGLALFHGDRSLLGKISNQRGSLRGLLTRHGSFPPWDFSPRETDIIRSHDCMLSRKGGVLSSSYTNSAIYFQHEKAESELSMLLSNLNVLRNQGAATLQRVLADMGLVASAKDSSEEWEKQARSYFDNMYNPLIEGWSSGTLRVQDATEAMQVFGDCLKKRQENWHKIRSSIFQDSNDLDSCFSKSSTGGSKSHNFYFEKYHAYALGHKEDSTCGTQPGSPTDCWTWPPTNEPSFEGLSLDTAPVSSDLTVL